MISMSIFLFLYNYYEFSVLPVGSKSSGLELQSRFEIEKSIIKAANQGMHISLYQNSAYCMRAVRCSGETSLLRWYTPT